VHLLDHGDHIRDAARWEALVSATSPITRSETYVSGVCPYHLMVCGRSRAGEATEGRASSFTAAPPR
jgi:hypothetical protein